MNNTFWLLAFERHSQNYNKVHKLQFF